MATFPPRSRFSRFVCVSRPAAAVLAIASCGHDAWLGMQCPETDVRCDDVTSAVVGGGAVDAGLETRVMAEAVPDGPQGAETADRDAGPSPETMSPSSEEPVVASEACRKVTMSFFACASSPETESAPRLLAGRAYTLRLHGTYALDTTFQLQGADASCRATMFGSLTLMAGEPLAERCLVPSEDVALLLTVVSGDTQVWQQDGLRAELCDGCQ